MTAWAMSVTGLRPFKLTSVHPVGRTLLSATRRSRVNDEHGPLARGGQECPPYWVAGVVGCTRPSRRAAFVPSAPPVQAVDQEQDHQRDAEQDDADRGGVGVPEVVELRDDLQR